VIPERDQIPGSAKPSRNAIRWNGKAGSRAAAAGVYRIVLRATSGGQAASDAATVRITGRRGVGPEPASSPEPSMRPGRDPHVSSATRGS
jgi:hypothetical protein